MATIIVFGFVALIIVKIRQGIYRRRVINAAARLSGDVQTISVAYYLLERANYVLSRLIQKKVK